MTPYSWAARYNKTKIRIHPLLCELRGCWGTAGLCGRAVQPPSPSPPSLAPKQPINCNAAWGSWTSLYVVNLVKSRLSLTRGPLKLQAEAFFLCILRAKEATWPTDGQRSWWPLVAAVAQHRLALSEEALWPPWVCTARAGPA